MARRWIPPRWAPKRVKVKTEEDYEYERIITTIRSGKFLTKQSRNDEKETERG